jgi:RimJ/RimL family protein N-acetyltransferase
VIIEPTRDVERIKRILSDPWLADRITEDGAEGMEIPVDGGVVYLVDENDSGVFIIQQLGAVEAEIHINMTQEGRKVSEEFATECLRMIWAETGLKKLVAQIPECYPDVIRFAEKMGLKREGVNEGSYLKGRLFNKVYLGIKRPEAVKDGVC